MKYTFLYFLIFITISCTETKPEKQNSHEQINNGSTENIVEPDSTVGTNHFYTFGNFLLELPDDWQILGTNKLDFTVLKVSSTKTTVGFSFYVGGHPSLPFPLKDYLNHPIKSHLDQLKELELDDNNRFYEQIEVSVYDTLDNELVFNGESDLMIFECIKKDGLSIWKRTPYGGKNKSFDVAVIPDSSFTKLHFFGEIMSKKDLDNVTNLIEGIKLNE